MRAQRDRERDRMLMERMRQKEIENAQREEMLRLAKERERIR